MSSLSDLVGKPKPAQPKRASSAVLWRTNSTLRFHEQQRKAAKYEAMIQRFQIRRVADNTSAGSKVSSRNIVIDKRFDSNRGNWKYFSIRRLSRKLKKGVAKIIPEPSISGPVLPTSFVGTLHGLTMICAIHFQLFYLPFAPIFHPTGSPETFQIDVVLEILAVVDIFMTFNTAYNIKRADPVISRRRIASRYLRGWFFFDLISALPLQCLRMLLHCESNWHELCIHSTPLVLMRLIRSRFRGSAKHASDRLSALIKYSRYTNLVDIARLLWLVLVIAHYMACFWHILDDHPLRYGNTVAEQYIASYFYAVSLIHGQGNISDDWTQNLLATFIILVGSVIVATIFGNVAMLVSNFNANSTNYQRKMESVFATMDKMELPDRLRDRIQQYYAHVWTEYESLDGDLVKFQRELTHTLGLEVGLYKYMSLVNDIPFWIDCSPDFIAQIVLTLVVRVYLPDDYVVRQGEICDEMFMINRGICEVSSIESSTSDYLSAYGNSRRNTVMQTTERYGSKENSRVASRDQIARVNAVPSDCCQNVTNLDEDGSGREIVRTSLRHGQAFGEMSLLMNYGQPSSVRAIAFVEMCVLERSAFQRIISRYPVDRRRVMKNMVGNCIQKNEIPFAWEKLCQKQLELDLQNNNYPSVDMLTPSEVVDILVDKIDAERPDNSIMYGFQCVNGGGQCQDDSFTAMRVDRGLSHELYNATEVLNPDPQPSTTRSEISASPDADLSNLCLKMFVMLIDLTSAVERLERSQHNHQVECCNAVRANKPYDPHLATDMTQQEIDNIRARAAVFGGALAHQMSRTGSNYSNSSQQSAHHPFISHSLASEHRGSASSSGSVKRWTIALGEQPNPHRGLLSSLSLPTDLDTELPPDASQSTTSARSTQHALSTPPIPGDYTGGASDYRLGSADHASSHANAVASSSGSHDTILSTRKKSSDSPAKVQRGGSRNRVSIDAAQNAKPLRKLFLTSRMSSPSSARGTSWGLAANTKRLNTAKDATLADQLWERRRKQSREALPS